MGKTKCKMAHYLVGDIAVAAVFIAFLMPLHFGCSGAPVKTPENKPVQQAQNNSVPPQDASFQRKMYSPAYNGFPAVIFRMDDVARGWNEEAVERIIKLFGKNDIPLDVGIIPHADGKDSFDMPLLKNYLDVGIIDITVHGDTHVFGEFDTDKSGISYQKLKSGLAKARSQIQKYYGLDPVAFTAPNDFFNEDGYNAVKDAGFKVFSTQSAVDVHPSLLPVDYNGILIENGMSRLCTVSDVAGWDATTQKWGEIFSVDAGNPLFNAIDWGIKNLGVAVVGIHPQAFLDNAGRTDSAKMDKLEAIIKIVKQKNTVTTFDGWYRYAVVELMGPQHVRLKKTPAFSGGPAIIFRMDDAWAGFYEDSVEEIIKIFQNNGVPLDVGVEPYADGKPSYRVLFLLKYLDGGVIDISVHGYRNSFLEFDTVLSGASYDELDKSLKGCFQNSYGQGAYKPVKTNYEDLKAGLIRVREQYRRYFGVEPVSFTVPNDYFNMDGYRAVQDAGFKVFSAQMETDPFPSATAPVDYYGKVNKNGMYRLFSVTNTAEWDNSHCKWGDILRLETPADPLYADMLYGLRSVMNTAVITMHPVSYTDAQAKPDPARLKVLDSVIKYILSHKETFGQITTFHSWYEYSSRQKPQ